MIFVFRVFCNCKTKGERFVHPLWYLMKNYYFNVSSTNCTDSYSAETHVIEEALKERHLTGQSVRAVAMMMFLS